MTDPILTWRHGSIIEITLNRPDVYNALNMEMMILLGETLASAAANEAVQGVIITGKGKAFCSGGDLRSISQQSEAASYVLHRLAPQFHLSIVEIRRMKKPVVAALNGIAAGGGFSLALACDFRVMGEAGVLRQAYTSSGLSMDGGGSFALPRLVGLARAMEILAFDEPIPAVKALEWGLVTKVVPDEQVLPESIAMLEKLTSRSIHSFAWSKKLMTDSFTNSLESQLELERQGISNCAVHPDGQEGIRAFVEKRKPDFSRPNHS